MDTRDRSPFLLPFIILLGMMFPFMTMRQPSRSQTSAKEQPASPSPTPAKGTPEQNQRPARDLSGLVMRFFGLDTKVDTVDTKVDTKKPSPKQKVPGAGPYQIRFLVATVPDPLDSPLPYMFDSALESIQLAANADGFVLDRSYLPWTRRAQSRDTSSKDGTRRLWHTEPGVLLFRRAEVIDAAGSDKSKKQGTTLLAVMLVGETPTSGIQKDAFAKALGDIYELNQRVSELEPPNSLAVEEPCQINVLGPTFSGSAVSLRMALDKWLADTSTSCRDKNPRANIISGTATAIDKTIFDTNTPTEQNGTAQGTTKNDSVNGKIRFRTAMLQNSDVFGKIWNYLGDLGYCKVALFAEAGSDYGMSGLYGAENQNTASSLPETRAPAPGQSSTLLKCKDHFFRTDKEMQLIRLPFPLYIAQLRKETGIERKLSQPAQQGDISLPMPEEDPSGGVPRSFSPFSATYAELSLTNLLTTISDEGVRAVGILATDMQDTVFLAREIREHAPNVLIFTFLSDLHYTHPDVNSSTYGMLVFTPYSLINANQRWSYPFRNDLRLQFPSQIATGIYNGAVALLQQQEEQLKRQVQQAANPQTDKGMRESKPTQTGGQQTHFANPEDWVSRLRKSSVERGKPFADEPQADPPPALWVTIIGHNAIMPVSILQKPNASPPVNLKIRLHTSAVSFGVVMMSCLFLAFSGLLSYVYWPRHKKEHNGKHWLLWRLNDPFSHLYQPWSRFYLLICCLVLLLLYGSIALLYSLPATVFELSEGDRLVLALVVFTVMFLLTAIIVLTIRWREALRLASGKKNHAFPNSVRLALFSVCGITSSLLLALMWNRYHAFAWERAFHYLRAFDWASGVSPLLPFWLIGVAGFLWAFGSFIRLKMVDGIRSETEKPHSTQQDSFASQKSCSFLNLQENCFEGLSEELSKLESEAKASFQGWSMISNPWQFGVVLAFAVLIAGYFVSRRFLPTVEGPEHDWLFACSYFFVYGVLALECIRLWRLWWELRRFVKALGWTPMRMAFARYHKKHPSLPRISFATPAPVFTVLEFSVEQASELVQRADKTDEHLAHWVQEAAPRVREAHYAIRSAHKAESEKNRGKSLAERNKAQCALSGIVRSLSKVLEQHWLKQCDDGPQKNTEEPVTIYSVSEEFSAGHATQVLALKKTEQKTSKEGQEPATFHDLAEEFIAGRAVHFISFILPAIRSVSGFVLCGLLLMLFASVCYPFQPRNDFLLFNWIVILAFISSALTIVVQMERDFVMSSLNGSDPGKVNFSFDLVFRFLAYGLVPIAALLGAEFPSVLGKLLPFFGSSGGQ